MAAPVTLCSLSYSAPGGCVGRRVAPSPGWPSSKMRRRKAGGYELKWNCMLWLIKSACHLSKTAGARSRKHTRGLQEIRLKDNVEESGSFFIFYLLPSVLSSLSRMKKVLIQGRKCVAGRGILSSFPGALFFQTIKKLLNSLQLMSFIRNLFFLFCSI